jgi:Co/Zn/Cd efflux system component
LIILTLTGLVVVAIFALAGWTGDYPGEFQARLLLAAVGAILFLAALVWTGVIHATVRIHWPPPERRSDWLVQLALGAIVLGCGICVPLVERLGGKEKFNRTEKLWAAAIGLGSLGWIVWLLYSGQPVSIPTSES